MADKPAPRLRRWLGVAIAAALLAAALYVLLPGAPPPTQQTKYVDMHVHVAGIGAGGSGAFVGDGMRSSFRFPFYLRAFGVTEPELAARGDAVLFAKISAAISASKRVEKAVVLAMDGVIAADGTLDRQATQIYVPNDYVAREAARYDNLCFGASVNPHRPDALERLRKAAADGALLVKWIPNIMGIDPGDPLLRPFYRELVARDLPLLTHTGQERSFETAIDELGDPARLALPLSLGVTVIAAHIGTRGANRGEANFDRILALFDRYPRLYADISSLTQINKLGDLDLALAVPGLEQRLVNGSDWPLQFFPLVSPYYHAAGIPNARSITAIDNVWDRDIALKEALGTPPEVLERSAKLLDIQRCEA